MMNRVFKYPLKVSDEQIVVLPSVRKVLCVEVQGGIPCLWAEVNTESEELKPLRVLIFGTGHAMPDDPGRYLGTFQLVGGSFVGHVYLKGE